MAELDLAFTRPARSYLYSPTPVGLGTGMVESLAGYLARLANSHCVGAADLLRCLSGKTVEPAPATEHWVYNIMQPRSRELNEMQAVAQRWSRLIAGQTLREGLDQLTLLPWRDLITPRIITHKSQCWCSVCLDSWAAEGQTIYWPLLWSLRAVTVCPAHQLLLEDRCWRCQARVPSLTSNALPGFCRKCDAWLGLSERTAPYTQLSDFVTEDAMKIAQGALAMLAAASLNQHDVTLEKLVRMLQWCLRAANCRQIDLARALKLEPQASVTQSIMWPN